MRVLRRNMTIVLCLVTAVLAQAEDKHPYASAQVGDWIEYKTSTKMSGMSMDQNMKQTVIKKTETEVTIEILMAINGQEMKQPMVIKLNEKYEPFKQEGNASVKELGSGSEKISTNGKSYDTNWKEVELTATQEGQVVKTKSKVWSCLEVPLGGLVKMETDIAGMGTTTMELQGFGKGK